jgi:hypothetical protein
LSITIMPDYDDTVFLDRKLTQDETSELRITLLPYFHVAGGGAAIEDVTDFLDYTFAMISNNKDVGFVIKELMGMEMEFCPPEIAEKVGRELSSFVTKLNGGGDGEGANELSGNVESMERGEEREENTTVAEGAKGSRVVSLKVGRSVRMVDVGLRSAFPASSKSLRESLRRSSLFDGVCPLRFVSFPFSFFVLWKLQTCRSVSCSLADLENRGKRKCSYHGWCPWSVEGWWSERQ